MNVDEIRCPGKLRHLFAKLDIAARVGEVSCQDCRKAIRLSGSYPVPVHVLHVFSLDTGELLGTVHQWSSGARTAVA